MARPLRLEHEGALWHVTARGNERKNIFRSDADRLLFLALLSAAVERFNWIVHVYTLMSNHFHLVIETPEKTLSRGMQRLNGQYAKKFNKWHKRVGHLFQGRVHGELVQKESQLLELTRYIVLNPVRAGMVERPEDYRWSSYRATVGREPAPEWLTTTGSCSSSARIRSARWRPIRTYLHERIRFRGFCWKSDSRRRTFSNP